MTMYQQYYLENLYPLQNDIIRIVNGKTDQFYLTGGTALSRGYLNHRYSDDLDFFTNMNPSFVKSCTSALEGLVAAGYTVKDEISNPLYFVRKKIFDKDMSLCIQIDFINDIEAHFGNITQHPYLYRIDSIQNILSNKLCAVLGRSDAKDVVDLWAICKKTNFSWADILREAEVKDDSIDSRYISGTIQSLPEREFDKIKWISKPSFNEFMKDVANIAVDMTLQDRNSLFQKKDINKKQKSR